MLLLEKVIRNMDFFKRFTQEQSNNSSSWQNSFSTFLTVHGQCWHFEDQVRICEEEEDPRNRHCHSLTSGGTFDTWSMFDSLQTCGESGKLWHRRHSCGSTWQSFGSSASSRYLPEVLPGTFTLPIGEVLSIERPSRWSFCDPFHGGTPSLLFARV